MVNDFCKISLISVQKNVDKRVVSFLWNIKIRKPSSRVGFQYLLWTGGGWSGRREDKGKHKGILFPQNWIFIAGDFKSCFYQTLYLSLSPTNIKSSWQFHRSSTQELTHSLPHISSRNSEFMTSWHSIHLLLAQWNAVNPLICEYKIMNLHT